MRQLNSLGIAIEPPSGPFPFGQLKNSNPLGSGNGSAAIAEWANDPIQMIYAALDHFGISISDVAEQVGDSDFIRILEGVLPVGTFLPAAFTTDPATLDIRCLPCEGQTVSEVTYAALFARIGTAFNTGGEPGGSFRLPETRGEGIRGFDDGRGIDPARVFGSYQLDEFKSHTHDADSFALAGTLGNVFRNDGSVNNPATLTTLATGGSETRMRNFTAKFLIRY